MPELSRVGAGLKRAAPHAPRRARRQVIELALDSLTSELSKAPLGGRGGAEGARQRAETCKCNNYSEKRICRHAGCRLM